MKNFCRSSKNIYGNVLDLRLVKKPMTKKLVCLTDQNYFRQKIFLALNLFILFACKNIHFLPNKNKRFKD